MHQVMQCQILEEKQIFRSFLRLILRWFIPVSKIFSLFYFNIFLTCWEETLVLCFVLWYHCSAALFNIFDHIIQDGFSGTETIASSPQSHGWEVTLNAIDAKDWTIFVMYPISINMSTQNYVYLCCFIHRNMTSVMPTAASHTDIIVEGVPHSLQRSRPAPSRHFRLRMNTNEYRKKSDNWIVLCLKLSSEFWISCKV